MAETYRGLTIRIGGDTTALTKALKYSNGAISQTQIELNKLAQALKMDPSNVQVYNMHLGYMGQQASNTAMKLAQLRDAQESVSSEPIKIVVDGSVKEATETFGEFVQKYRDGTANIAADTANAKRVLDSYTEQLAKVYTDLTGYVSNASSVETEKLRSAFEFAMAPAGKLDELVTKVWERFYTLPDGIERSDDSIEKLTSQAQELGEAFGGFFDKATMKFDVNEFTDAIKLFSESTEGAFGYTEEQIADMASKINQYVNTVRSNIQKMGDSADASTMEQASENIANYISDIIGSTQLMSAEFNNANRNVSLDNIEKVLESLREETGMSDEQVLNLLTEIETLQDGFKEADTAYKNFLQAEKLIDLEVEIEKTIAQTHAMARAMADIKVPDSISRTLMYIQENVEALKTSFTQLIDTAGSMSNVISKAGTTSVNVDFGDPTSNVEAFEVAMRSLVEAEQTVEEGLAAIRREMDEFTGNDVFLEDVTDSTKSATQQLYDAKDAMVDAETSLKTLNGTIDHYKGLLDALVAIGDIGLQSFIVSHDGEELDAETKEVVEMLSAIEDLNARKQELAKYTDNVRQKLENLRGGIDETTGKYKNLAAAEGVAADAQEEFENAKMRVALEKLQADLVNTQNQTMKVDEAIRNLAKSMTEQMTTGFSLNVFGEADEKIKTMKGSFDAAIERAKLLSDTAKEMPKNVELAAKKTGAISEALNVGKQYVQELKNQMANILPDGATEEVDALVEEFGSAHNAVVVLTGQVNDLNLKLVQLRQQRDLAPEGSERWEELDSEVKILEGNLGYVESRLHGIAGATVGAIQIERWEEWSDKVEQVEGQLSQLGKGVVPNASGSTDSAAFEQVFDRMLQYVERVGSAVVESANTIDAAYRDMRKTVQGTEEQFRALKDAAVEFSQTHAVSTDTLLKMEALGGQLGVATESLEEFGEVASNLDIATDIDAETIALQLGQISNVMSDLNEGTFDNFSDALVRLGNNMAAQESSIMNVAQRMSSVANVAGMTTPDLLAWASAIASTGQRSESAATAVSNTMTGIAAAVAAGGKKLEAFANIADMSAEQFATSWMTNPTEALKAFIYGLESLSDTNTGAIAALEEMGISSVRQETALLGLASTVDVLDDALKMSNDAFDGVSDEWGQAGDAAIEAQKKSEGFSGSLSIMQNNAANLAESLGDSLVLPIQIASEALKGLTDLLNFVPDPIKGIAIGIAGFTAVGGTALDAIDKLKNGFEGLSKVPAGSAIETITLKLMELSPALDNNVALAASLSTGLAMGGAVIATAAIGALVSTLADLYEQSKEAKEAEEALNDANQHLEDSIDGVADKSETLGEKFKVIKVAAQDATDATNELAGAVDAVAQRIEDRQIDMDIDFSKVDEAVEVLSRFSDATKLSYDEQAELIDAVDVLNDKMGTSFEVVDATKGVIKDLGDGSTVTAGQIKQWADSYKNVAEGEKLVKDMDDTEHLYMETQNKLAEAKEKLAKLQEQEKQGTVNVVQSRREEVDATLSQINAQAELGKEYAGTGESVENQKQIVKTYEKELEELGQQYDEQKTRAHDLGVEEVMAADQARAAIEKFLEVALAERGKSSLPAEEMAAQLVSLGATATDMVELTDYQLTTLVNAYDGSAESIAKTLAKLGIDVSGAMDKIGEAAKEAAEAVGKASQEEIRATQEAHTAEYNELKHKLDKDYDALKDSNDKKYNEKKRYYDQQYDGLKRELDKEYTEHKRGLDADYDLMKNDFDRKYDLKKRELDKQYDTEKSTRDKAYDDLKKSLDAEYKDEKRIRDSAYDDLKKSLDAEYDAEKSMRDKAYDNHKKMLDKEYDAQKKTLDAEYDQLKKSLDKQSNERKKSLDKTYNDRKKALDNEYKAAQKASKKYLDDYKKAQKAEVNAFKKATDARVKEINRELDAKKKLIETEKQRKTDDIDARISALKGETEAEEKQQKQREQQEKLSELRKDVEKAKSRRTRAEAEKAYNDYVTELAQEAAKEQRDATIEKLEQEKSAIETNAEERITALEEQYGTEVEKYKESRDLELEILQEHLDAMYTAEQEAETLRLEEKKARNDAELAALKERNDAELAAFKETQAAQLEAVKESNEAQLAATKERHEAELENMKLMNEAELESIKANNEMQLEEVKLANENELAAIKEGHTQQLADLKETHEQELSDIKISNEDQLQALKDGQQQQLDAKKLAHEQDLQQMKYDHDDKLQQKRYENEDNLKVFKEGLDGELQALKDSNTAQLEELKAHQTHVINQMRSGQTDVDKVLDEGAKSVDEKSKGAAEKFDKNTAQMETDGKKNAENGMKSLWNTINENSGNVGFAVKEGPVKAASDEMSLLPDVFKKSADSGVKNFAGTVKESKDVASSTKKMVDTASKEADKTKEPLGKAGEKGRKEYGKKIGEGNDGKEGATKQMNNALSGLDTFPTKMGDVGKKGAKSLSESLGNYDFSGTASNVGTRFVNKLSEFNNDHETVGHNWAVGIENGVNGVNLNQFAYNVGIGALDQIKAALGINSPSREMMKVGRYFVQGAEVGIRQEKSGIERETRLLAQSMLDDMTPTLDVDALKHSSDTFMAEYKSILGDMSAMSRDRAIGVGSVGAALDADRLRSSANKYLAECRKGVDEVLKAAEEYSRSADQFDANFDVKSFRESADEYVMTYRRAIDDVTAMMREYNTDALARGASPLTSDFDIDALNAEAMAFMADYDAAVSKVEAMAAEHAANVGTFDSEFDADSLDEQSKRYVDRYQNAIGRLEELSDGFSSRPVSLDGAFDLAGLVERSESYLGEYRSTLDAITAYADEYASEIGKYDVGGLGGGVSIGTDIMASVMDGMRSMEGELERQIARLVGVIEEGFDPSLDTEEMDASATRILNTMKASMDSLVGEWRRGASDMVAAQAALVADVGLEQTNLARRLSVVVDGGFGDDRLTDQVNAFLDRTVQAAYEAIDSINSRMRNSAMEIAEMQAASFGKAQMVGMAQMQPATVNINVTLTDVTIRETADIDRLAQALAQRTNQIMRSRIG